MTDQDGRALARRIHQLEERIAALGRARQISRSSVPVEVDGDEGPVTVDVPLVPAVAEGLKSGAKAQEALEHANQALDEIANLPTTAAGFKRVRSVDEPDEPESGWERGDEWVLIYPDDHVDPDLRGQSYEVRVWNGTEFVHADYLMSAAYVVGPNGVIQMENGRIVAPVIITPELTGGTLTGSTVRTAPSGQRLELDVDGLRAFNSAGSVVNTLRSDSAGMRFDGSTHAPSYVGINATSHPDGYAGNGVTFDAGEQNDIAAASAHIGTIRQSDGFVRSTLSLGVDYDNGDKWMGASLQVQATSGSAPSAAVFRSQNSDLLIAAGFGNEQKITLDSRTEPAGNMVVDPEDLDDWDAVEGTIAWVWGESRQYVKTGSGWVPWYDGANDTDWLPMSLSGGWSGDVEVRCKGGLVKFQGNISNSSFSGPYAVLANLPGGFPRPSQNVASSYAPGVSSTTFSDVRIDTNGELLVRRGGTSSLVIPVSGLSYFAD